MSSRRKGMVNSLRIKSPSFTKNTGNTFDVLDQDRKEVKFVIKKEGFIFDRNPYRYEKVEDVQKLGRKTSKTVKFFIFLDEGEDIEFEIKPTEDAKDLVERFKKQFFNSLCRVFMDNVRKMKREIKLKEEEIEESKEIKKRIIEDTEEKFMKKFKEEDEQLTIRIVKEFNPLLSVNRMPGSSGGISTPINLPEYSSDMRRKNEEVVDDEEEREFYIQESISIIDQCLRKFEGVRQHLHTETSKILEKKRDDLLSFQSAQSLAWGRKLKNRENEMLLKEKLRKLEGLQNRIKSFQKNILGK